MPEKRSHENIKAIRWDVEDWELLATIAKRVGLTRSAFIKRAAMRDASLVLAGAAPQYVSGEASTHTGGAATFSNAKQTTKRVTEERGPSATAKQGPADARKKPTPKAG